MAKFLQSFLVVNNLNQKLKKMSVSKNGYESGKKFGSQRPDPGTMITNQGEFQSNQKRDSMNFKANSQLELRQTR